MKFFCDTKRHLVCLPYSIEGLNAMADELKIKRCWFHRGSRYAHYDIPVQRIAEISARCTVITSRQLLTLVKTGVAP